MENYGPFFFFFFGANNNLISTGLGFFDTGSIVTGFPVLKSLTTVGG